MKMNMNTTVMSVGTAVNCAKTHAQKTTIVVDSQKLENAQKRLRTLETVKKNLFDLEDPSEINEGISKCKAEIAEQDRRDFIQNIGAKGYQLLDKEPFTWRNQDGLPRLAPFLLTSNTCTIPELGDIENKWSDFPGSVKKYYGDVRKTLDGVQKFADSGKCWWMVFMTFLFITEFVGWHIAKPLTIADTANKIGAMLILSLFCLIIAVIFGGIVNVIISDIFGKDDLVKHITARFKGIIPSEAKEQIHTAQRTNFFKEIFILAEVPEWEVKKERRAVAPTPRYSPSFEEDPLIVGFDGERFWLIGAFDLTSLERHIANEYAVRAEE